jgi:hypothetical protein
MNTIHGHIGVPVIAASGTYEPAYEIAPVAYRDDIDIAFPLFPASQVHFFLRFFLIWRSSRPAISLLSSVSKHVGPESY